MNGGRRGGGVVGANSETRYETDGGKRYHRQSSWSS